MVDSKGNTVFSYSRLISLQPDICVLAVAGRADRPQDLKPDRGYISVADTRFMNEKADEATPGFDGIRQMI